MNRRHDQNRLRPGMVITRQVALAHRRIRTRRSLTPYCFRCGQVGELRAEWANERGGLKVCRCPDNRFHWQGPLPRPWKKAR